MTLELDVGCGSNKRRPDLVGVDSRSCPGVDVVCDVNQGLPFDNGTVDTIYSSHFLEHVDDLEHTLGEFLRVLKPEGRLHIIVPHFSNPLGYSDYTHRRFFGYFTFNYFAKAPARYGPPPHYNPNLNLKIIRKTLVFKQWPIVGGIVESIVNRWELAAYIYESRFTWLFPCFEIVFELERDG